MPYSTLIATPTPTVLVRIATELDTRLKAMVDEDGNKLWHNVVKGDIPPNNLGFPVVGVQQGPEETIAHLWPFHDKIVSFYFEFKFNSILNVDSFDIFRYYLGKLQQRLFGVPDNISLGGLSINVVETGNNPEIEGASDPTPGGLLMTQITYRHWSGDPYHLPTEEKSYPYGTVSP